MTRRGTFISTSRRHHLDSQLPYFCPSVNNIEPESKKRDTYVPVGFNGPQSHLAPRRRSIEQVRIASRFPITYEIEPLVISCEMILAMPAAADPRRRPPDPPTPAVSVAAAYHRRHAESPPLTLRREHLPREEARGIPSRLAGSVAGRDWEVACSQCSFELYLGSSIGTCYSRFRLDVAVRAAFCRWTRWLRVNEHSVR